MQLRHFQARDLGFRVFEAHFHVKNFMDRPIKQKRVVMVTANSLILVTVIFLTYQSFVTSLIDQGHLITFNCNQPLYFYYNEYNTPVHFCIFKPLLKVVIQILMLGCFQFRNTHNSFSWKWHFLSKTIT